MFVIFDGSNLYWCNHLKGWVDNVGHATWYGDKFTAKNDANECDGQILKVNGSTYPCGLSPLY